MSDVVAVVLAAGRASRFGAPKQLAELDGVPLVVRAVRAAAPAGRVVVVTGAGREAVACALAGEDAEVVVAEDWADGLSASLRRGVTAAGDAWMLVLLADQPGVTADVVARVLAAPRRGDAVRASFGGRAAHPVLLHPRLFPALRELRGDRGAGPVLAGADVLLVPCDDLGTDRDVDTPADLRALALPRADGPG